MFAPYCPTCRSRQLLWTSRIVESSWTEGGSIRLECRCGAVVDADARQPQATILNIAPVGSARAASRPCGVSSAGITTAPQAASMATMVASASATVK
ncbi:hypothetical protein BH24ACT6_BH24ACT6_16930 [soil metagenome]